MARFVDKDIDIRFERRGALFRIVEVGELDRVVAVIGRVLRRVRERDGAADVRPRLDGDAAEGGEEVVYGIGIVDVAAEDPGRGAVGVVHVVGFDRRGGVVLVRGDLLAGLWDPAGGPFGVGEGRGGQVGFETGLEGLEAAEEGWVGEFAGRGGGGGGAGDVGFGDDDGGWGDGGEGGEGLGDDEGGWGGGGEGEEEEEGDDGGL